MHDISVISPNLFSGPHKTKGSFIHMHFGIWNCLVQFRQTLLHLPLACLAWSLYGGVTVTVTGVLKPHHHAAKVIDRLLCR